MPLAVTHVLLTIVAVDLYRDFVAKHKKYFTLWTLFFAGVGGLLPDLDHPLYAGLKFLGYDVPELSHGMAMHTPMFGAVFLIPFAALWAMKKHKLAVLFLVMSFGVFFHLFLDWLIGGGSIDGIMLAYPFSSEASRGPFIGLMEGFPLREGIDAMILLAWLFNIERRRRIRDFI